MTINATLIGQMITFALFVWFTMKFVWPHINKALGDRQTKIADGLAAAERGHHELELAQQKVTQSLREAKEQAAGIVDSANRRANQLIEEAKQQALVEKQRMLARAQEEINLELTHAKAALRKEVAGIAVAGAEKILSKAVDQQVNDALLSELADELSS